VLACSDGDQIASVPRIATVLAREMPHAQLHVVSIDPLAASDGLAAGTVDGSLSPVGVPTEGLHTEPLYTDEAVVVLRADHPIRSRRLSREQFNSLRHIDVWLVLGRAGVGNQVAAAYFKRHGTVRNVAVIVPGFAAAMVAAATDMAAGMPRRVAEHLARHLPLRVAHISAPPMRIQLQLVWHARTHEDPGARTFRSLIRGRSASRHRARAGRAGLHPSRPRGGHARVSGSRPSRRRCPGARSMSSGSACRAASAACSSSSRSCESSVRHR